MCHRSPGRSLRPPSPLLLLLPLLLQPPWAAGAAAKQDSAGEQNAGARSRGAALHPQPTPAVGQSPSMFASRGVLGRISRWGTWKVTLQP